MFLANLDNEVIFKKAFTNKLVFKSFVKDVLGIDFEVGKIETEKKFTPPIGYIDFKLDIYAESEDRRVCVEIQRLEYDHHFDRFLHYFLMLIAEQQKSARDYNIDQTVYMIVILTEKYTISEKNGRPIKDEVLLLNFNPQTIAGEIRDLYGHQFVCLNPNYSDKNTPEGIRDWLDLIYQSIHNPERPVLNIENQGIKKAAELISFDNLTPEERAESKNKEAAKVTLFKREEQARIEERALAEAEKEILKKEAEEARRQKEEALRKQEEALRKQEEALRKQEEALRKQEEALRKQEEALRNSVQGFLEFGATKEQIAKKLNLSQEEVELIINKLG